MLKLNPQRYLKWVEGELERLASRDEFEPSRDVSEDGDAIGRREGCSNASRINSNEKKTMK